MKDLEPKVTEFIEKRLRSDMVFVDVGAYHGFYTLLAAPIVKQVLAFEPSAEHLGQLEQNVAKLSNVVIRPHALFSHFCFGTLGEGVRWDMFQKGDGITMALPLDAVRKDSIDFIKIDVEGAELDVLLGAEETIHQWHPILVIEPHWMMEAYFGHTVAELEDFLRAHGYDWRGLDYNGELHDALMVDRKGCHLAAW